jgi:hypothetical protein
LVIAIGYNRAGFGVSTDGDVGGEQPKVKVWIDEKKMESDTEEAKAEVTGAINRTVEKCQGK